MGGGFIPLWDPPMNLAPDSDTGPEAGMAVVGTTRQDVQGQEERVA